MGKLPERTERLPLFIAAGVIKEAADIDRLAQDSVVSGAVLGSYTRRRNEGDNHFRWNAERQTAYNRIRLTNPGSREAGRFLPEGVKKLHDVGQWALVGVVALPREDALETLPEMAQWAVETGANGVEIDASCPTFGSNDLLCHDVDKTGEVIEAVRQRIGKEPVLSVKVSDLTRSLINRYASSGIDIDLVDAINSQYGVSGPIIAPAAERNLAHWNFYLERNHRPDIGVISVGGVSGDRAGGAKVYDRVHKSGAAAVGIAQAAYRAPDLHNLTQMMAEGYYDAEASAPIA